MMMIMVFELHSETYALTIDEKRVKKNKWCEMSHYHPK